MGEEKVGLQGLVQLVWMTRARQIPADVHDYLISNMVCKYNSLIGRVVEQYNITARVLRLAGRCAASPDLNRSRKKGDVTISESGRVVSKCHSSANLHPCY